MVLPVSDARETAYSFCLVGRRNQKDVWRVATFSSLASAVAQGATAFCV